MRKRGTNTPSEMSGLCKFLYSFSVGRQFIILMAEGRSVLGYILLLRRLCLGTLHVIRCRPIKDGSSTGGKTGSIAGKSAKKTALQFGGEIPRGRGARELFPFVHSRSPGLGQLGFSDCLFCLPELLRQ